MKKESKSSQTYTSKLPLNVRSRDMASYNEIRVRQKQEARVRGLAFRAAKQVILPQEMQHQTVDWYYHKTMVNRCEVPKSNCREAFPAGQALRLEQKHCGGRSLVT